MVNTEDVAYMGTITVGNTSPLTYDLAFDTTVDFTWIPDTLCNVPCDDFIDDADSWTGYDRATQGGTDLGAKTITYLGNRNLIGKIYGGVKVEASSTLSVTMPVLSV